MKPELMFGFYEWQNPPAKPVDGFGVIVDTGKKIGFVVFRGFL